jgi:hypothetical protein
MIGITAVANCAAAANQPASRTPLTYEKLASNLTRMSEEQERP